MCAAGSFPPRRVPQALAGVWMRGQTRSLGAEFGVMSLKIWG
jgi:hypothetical protein